MFNKEFYLNLENKFNDYCISQKVCSDCKYNKITNCSMVFAFEQGKKYEKEKMEDDRK